jgi:hypothetical protein
MTKRKWVWLLGSVVFGVSTGWFVSEFVASKASSDGVLASALTIRI